MSVVLVAVVGVEEMVSAMVEAERVEAERVEWERVEWERVEQHPTAKSATTCQAIAATVADWNSPVQYGVMKVYAAYAQPSFFAHGQRLASPTPSLRDEAT